MRRETRTSLRITSAVIIAVALIPCTTMAALIGTVDIAHDGYGASEAIQIWGGGLVEFDGHAGVSLLNKTAGTCQGEQWANGHIAGFCIELSEFSSNYTRTYDVALPSEAQNPTTFLGQAIGSEKANYIRELWGRYYDPAWANGSSFTNEQNNNAKAFGAAIWEIIYEDLPTSSAGWDVSVDGTEGSLGFNASGVDMYTANMWLHSLDGQGPMAELMALTNGGTQDFIVQVPEPATLLLLSMGSVALIRKRTRNA